MANNMIYTIEHLISSKTVQSDNVQLHTRDQEVRNHDSRIDTDEDFQAFPSP
jgi:hypothetical protein